MLTRKMLERVKKMVQNVFEKTKESIFDAYEDDFLLPEEIIETFLNHSYIAENNADETAFKAYNYLSRTEQESILTDCFPDVIYERY